MIKRSTTAMDMALMNAENTKKSAIGMIGGVGLTIGILIVMLRIE